nr:MAG TPA: hypothetical protein [Caudoviricetes sp.]
MRFNFNVLSYFTFLSLFCQYEYAYNVKNVIDVPILALQAFYGLTGKVISQTT